MNKLCLAIVILTACADHAPSSSVMNELGGSSYGGCGYGNSGDSCSAQLCCSSPAYADCQLQCEAYNEAQETLCRCERDGYSWWYGKWLCPIDTRRQEAQYASEQLNTCLGI